MRLYARQGRRGAALRQYQICVAVLHRELGVKPVLMLEDLHWADDMSLRLLAFLGRRDAACCRRHSAVRSERWRSSVTHWRAILRWAPSPCWRGRSSSAHACSLHVATDGGPRRSWAMLAAR